MIETALTLREAVLNMKPLLRKLGYRDKEYRGTDFDVRVGTRQRELVSVSYTRDGVRLNLEGERIGERWQGIDVRIPQDVDGVLAKEVARDLAQAFQAMGYSFVISRLLGFEIVSESESQAAICELQDMGYEIEVSADKSRLRQKMRTGVPRPDFKTVREQAPRMMSLLQAIHGKRPRFEVLAKSPDI